MADIIFNLDGVQYTVRKNENGTFSVNLSETEVFVLQPKFDEGLMFKWKTEAGKESPLIDKVGIMIETHNLKF